MNTTWYYLFKKALNLLKVRENGYNLSVEENQETFPEFHRLTLYPPLVDDSRNRH
ncbi:MULTISPECIES: hypothetical protein [Nostocales]|uniref:Uncharacterized protein n=3 Tax=Nostocales TaxID=1161 RepID=A0A8S9TFC5_9CYAN|nr:hypothetical protein [Tolypothrix bouteillei]KAF3889993.1 hypothetical protein DA73_0400034425 [Tolypothrix bouteillei VB521301]